jgi:hypothetical protein
MLKAGAAAATGTLAAGFALRLGNVRLGTRHVGRFNVGASVTGFPGCALPLGNVGQPYSGAGMDAVVEVVGMLVTIVAGVGMAITVCTLG